MSQRCCRILKCAVRWEQFQVRKPLKLQWNPGKKSMELMHITPMKKILVLERIRYADEKPVLLESTGFLNPFIFI